MSTVKYVLRDLPGVAELEARLGRIAAHPSPLWAPDFDGLEDEVDRVILRNFGFRRDPDDSVELEPDSMVDILTGRGWDLTDGQGGLLRSYFALVTAIGIVEEGLAGHLPGEPDDREMTPDETKDLEARLRLEVAKFRPKR